MLQFIPFYNKTRNEKEIMDDLYDHPGDNVRAPLY